MPTIGTRKHAPPLPLKKTPGNLSGISGEVSRLKQYAFGDLTAVVAMDCHVFKAWAVGRLFFELLA